MGVVFDEVVAQVEAPVPAAEAEAEDSGRNQSAHAEVRRWRQLQGTCARRQRRLEAD